jgi:hypothetical protein
VCQLEFLITVVDQLKQEKFIENNAEKLENENLK